MKINEVEALVGITKKNIRFYEAEGLLTPRRNSENGYRDYGEVEVETLEMVKDAVEAGADIIMLDNMDTETLREAVALIDKRAEIEVSGNVTKENIKRLVDLGVDYVSSGALTHSAPIMDISLKNLHPVNDVKEG